MHCIECLASTYYYYYFLLACWDKPSRHEDIRKIDENNELQQASW